MKLSDYYRQITKCKVGRGDTVLFWSDSWKSGPFEIKYPRLFSFVEDKLISVKKALDISDICEAFYLPVSVEAINELSELQS
jgi:hypothetical protein